MTIEAIKEALKQLESISSEVVQVGYKEVVKEYESQEKITHAIPWVMANKYSGNIFVQQLTCSAEHAEHEALFPLFTPDELGPAELGWVRGKERFQEQIIEAIKRLKSYLIDIEMIEELYQKEKNKRW